MTVVVSTPSRLHFGLLRFEQAEGPSYGGLGMMIDQPRWVVELDLADVWRATGSGSERALQFARGVLTRLDGQRRHPALRLRITSSIAQHCGFGGGTQLGLAIAAGTGRLLGLPTASAAELATLAGRGRRSAVGAHGFIHGGLIWETGREADEPLGRLAARVALPGAWRIVLIASPSCSGLSGADELDAFGELPPVPPETSAHLSRLAEEQILPAARRESLDDFGQAVYEYGRLAGQCFSPIQGGPYATPAIAECVRAIRELGVAGAGQSSWGPTAFAVTAGVLEAEQLVEALRRRLPRSGYEYGIAAPDNHGAIVADG
jgi:beta-RFAP synthase